MIKLESTVFKDTNGNINTGGKYINSCMSYTDSGNPLQTHIVVTWDSEIYKSVQTVQMRSYLKIAKVVATFVLSVELIIAMYGRYSRKTMQREHENV